MWKVPSIDCRYWYQFQIRDIPAWGMGQVGLPALGQPVGEMQPMEQRRYGYSQVSIKVKRSEIHVMPRAHYERSTFVNKT